MTQIMSAGLCEMLRTDPENGGVYRTRYERALTLVESQSTTELREAGAPLAREYGSWKNAKYRAKGLHASISDFKDFIRIHGPIAYSTRWRTRFHADGGQCSSVMADSVPR